MSALISDLKIHEGKCLALGILFTPFASSSFWVVYCVPTLDMLAKLYASVRTAMRSRSTYVNPVCYGNSLYYKYLLGIFCAKYIQFSMCRSFFVLFYTIQCLLINTLQKVFRLFSFSCFVQPWILLAMIPDLQYLNVSCTLQ